MIYQNSAGYDGSDYGPTPFCTSIARMAKLNSNFRTAFWTGEHLQMTLMSIPVRGDIGEEIHSEVDQLIRVESGQALVRMGERRERLDHKCFLNVGDAVFVPSGTWHNILNVGNRPLKLSSIYAPSQHPWGTVHRTKADAESEDY